MKKSGIRSCVYRFFFVILRRFWELALKMNKLILV